MKCVQHAAAGSENPLGILLLVRFSVCATLLSIPPSHITWPAKKRATSCNLWENPSLERACSVSGLGLFVSYSLLRKKKKNIKEKWKTYVEKLCFLSTEKVFISSPMTLSWTTFLMSFLGLMAWFVLHPPPKKYSENCTVYVKAVCIKQVNFENKIIQRV